MLKAFYAEDVNYSVREGWVSSAKKMKPRLMQLPTTS